MLTSARIRFPSKALTSALSVSFAASAEAALKAHFEQLRELSLALHRQNASHHYHCLKVH